MKYFDSIKKSFAKVDIYDHQAFNQRSFNPFNLTIFVILTVNIFLSAISLVLEAETFGDYSESFYVTATLTIVFVFDEEFTRNFYNINELIANFEKTIQKRSENPSSKLMYEKMDEKLKNRMEILQVSLMITLLGIMLPNLIVSFFIYFTTDLSNDAFRLAFPIWLPFEWRTPFGYFIPFSIQFVAFYCSVVMSEFNMGFLLGSCETLQTISIDASKNDLVALNDINKTGENPAEVKQKMREFVELLSDARQFARDFSDIYFVITTTFFVWSISTICSTLLMIQMEMNLGNFVEVVRPLTLISWSFAAFFMLANFGEQVSNRLDAIRDGITECEWYLFPNEVQKMFLTIMTATQQPIIFRGFGNILATRETFKKVANGGYTYFTMLRRFNN